MSDKGEPRERPPEQDRDADEVRDAARDDRAAGAGDLAEEDDEDRGPINLDRYFSKRRPTARVNVVHFITLVLMLAALVMIFAFKNRCGLMVANMFEQVSRPAPTTKGAMPAGRSDGGGR